MRMIECEEALERLWEFLDGELPSDDEVTVKQHLDLCGRCYPQYNFQQAYFRYTRRLAEREHVPPSLRRRLFEKILELET